MGACQYSSRKVSPALLFVGSVEVVEVLACGEKQAASKHVFSNDQATI
ncbi:hypothetical protein WDZ92_28200 [Nostoc sp. NIES-2111]